VARSSGERWLGYAGVAAFAALALLAALLWLREGQLIYVEQILSGLADCI